MVQGLARRGLPAQGLLSHRRPALVAADRAIHHPGRGGLVPANVLTLHWALPERRAKDEGRIRLHSRFPSRYLSTPRDIVVYLPPGYDQGSKNYPVLYLQDGQNLFDPATAFLGQDWQADVTACLLYTSPSPRDSTSSRMPSSA